MENKQDILNELKEISLLLSEIKEKSGSNPFKVPEAYFSNFEQEMMDLLEIENGSVSKGLEDFKKQNGLTVPSGYFDNLEIEIFAKIDAHEQPKPKTIDLQTYRQRGSLRIFPMISRIAVAAMLFVMVFVGIKFLNKPVEPTETTANNFEQQLADISKEEILNYIGNNSHDFDDQNLYALVENNLTTNNNITSNVSITEKTIQAEKVKETTIEQLTTEEINTYLNEHINEIDESYFIE